MAKKKDAETSEEQTTAPATADTTVADSTAAESQDADTTADASTDAATDVSGADASTEAKDPYTDDLAAPQVHDDDAPVEEDAEPQAHYVHPVTGQELRDPTRPFNADNPIARAVVS